MNISFFLDVKLVKKDNNVYTTGAVTKEYLNRHRLSESDKLTIICREDKNKDFTNKLALASDKNIEFIMFDSYKEAYKNRKLIKNIIKESDLINVKMPSNIGIIAMHYLLKQKKKYVVQMVGCVYDSLMNYGTMFAKLIAPLMYLINRHYIKKSENVIYVTEKFLQKRYPTKGKQIGCSDVSLPNNDENILMKRLEKIDEVKKDKIILGTIGNVDVKYKGQELVLDAIYELKKLGYNIEYQMVGGGEGSRLNKKAKKLNITESIKVVGPKPHEEIFKWLDNLDVYIQPSYTEGLCRSIIEAMSRACPCLVSDVGGNTELINERYIFKKGNVKSLYSKLLLLINSKDNMEESSRQNYSRSLDFEKGKLDAKRKEFYNTIIGE